MIGNSSNNRRHFTSQPKSTTLENLAVYRGVIDTPQSYHPLMEKFRAFLIQKGTDGMGFSDLQRHFHSFDRDHTKTIHPEEFKMAMQKMNMNFHEQEISELFAMFDIYGYGYIKYDEFMLAVRGQIHPRRRQLIAWAWYFFFFFKSHLVIKRKYFFCKIKSCQLFFKVDNLPQKNLF